MKEDSGLVRLQTIAQKFAPDRAIAAIEPYGSGNINRTFRVTLTGETQDAFILQQLNTQVFRQPQQVMQNMQRVTEHMAQRLQQEPLDGGRCWQVPRVRLAQNGCAYWLDADDSFWRALDFITGGQSFDTIQDRDRAQEIGWALGTFHRLISDLPTETLAETLPGFHIAPDYLAAYDRILVEAKPEPSPELNRCLEFVAVRRHSIAVLEDAKARGELQLRPIHGDPKVNNILLDAITGQAISLIDLDTVKPGLVHYDIGDCLRSACNPLGEETEQWQQVSFDCDRARALLQGYLAAARDFLTERDRAYLYDAIRLLAFELGLRFLTDYLAGNVYFTIRYPTHNLARALVQFQLAASIEAQESLIRAAIQDLQ